MQCDVSPDQLRDTFMGSYPARPTILLTASPSPLPRLTRVRAPGVTRTPGTQLRNPPGASNTNE